VLYYTVVSLGLRQQQSNRRDLHITMRAIDGRNRNERLEEEEVKETLDTLYIYISVKHCFLCFILEIGASNLMHRILYETMFMQDTVSLTFSKKKYIHTEGLKAALPKTPPYSLFVATSFLPCTK